MIQRAFRIVLKVGSGRKVWDETLNLKAWQLLAVRTIKPGQAMELQRRAYSILTNLRNHFDKLYFYFSTLVE